MWRGSSTCLSAGSEYVTAAARVLCAALVAGKRLFAIDRFGFENRRGLHARNRIVGTHECEVALVAAEAQLRADHEEHGLVAILDAVFDALAAADAEVVVDAINVVIRLADLRADDRVDGAHLLGRVWRVGHMVGGVAVAKEAIAA